MNNKIVSCHIGRLDFFNGLSLEIQRGDIVVFTGPNNAGKTQCLRDIEHFCKQGNKSRESIVIKSLELQKNNPDQLHEYLDKICEIHENCMGDEEYYALGSHRNIADVQMGFSQQNMLGDSFPFFVSTLNTTGRLGLCERDGKKPESGRKYIEPLQFMIHEKSYNQRLSDYFYKAFGEHLIPDDVSNDKATTLRIGEPLMSQGKVVSMFDEMEYFRQQLKKMPLIKYQGDGVKSFLGIVMELMMEMYSIFLVDEPEAFLHPPHARLLGRIMVELIGADRQLFLSSHSSDLIKGLLEVAPERVKVVRVERDCVTFLSTQTFDSVWKDPILRHSNIMESLFHQTSIIVESDGDCKLYSIVMQAMNEAAGRFPEVLFIHSDGKQRLAVVVSALKALHVDFRVVPDADILNNKDVFKKLFESCGGIWTDPLDEAYRVLEEGMPKNVGYRTRDEIRTELNAILDKSEDSDVSSEHLEKLKDILKQKSKWSAFKKSGLNSLSGETLVAANYLYCEASKVNLYPVPIGELESFVQTVGGHGPKWVNAVVEMYPDLNDPVYTPIKSFINSWFPAKP